MTTRKDRIFVVTKPKTIIQPLNIRKMKELSIQELQNISGGDNPITEGGIGTIVVQTEIDGF